MQNKKSTDEDIIARLRREAAAWFNNVTLLDFEELLRRYAHAKLSSHVEVEDRKAALGQQDRTQSQEPQAGDRDKAE
jgi:hypothetical protein